MIKLTERLLGPVTLILLALTFWLGLWVTPPDVVQGNLVRLLYVHPPIAWVALYVSFGTATIASCLYLWQRTRSDAMDRIAYCAMEISVVFIALTLAFLFLTIGAWGGGHTDMTKIGGWLGIITALLAWYASAAGVINETHGKVVLPVGPLG